VETDLNPFVYSRPLGPDEILDRDREAAELLRLAAGGHYVRLYAPRRYGKTSLLKKALAEGEAREGMVTVLVDLYGTLSLADVAIRIERAYADHLKGRVRDLVDRVLQATGLGLSLSGYGISLRLEADRKVDPLPALHALLDLPLRLGRDGGYRALIAFDEFQDVAKVPGLDALLRTHIQHQGDVASYVFAGSEPGLMRELFEVKARPLYGQAAPLRLGRLEPGDVAAYVDGRFAATGRFVGEALSPLLTTAEGHPQRAMLLAHRLWQELPRSGRATFEHWSAALEATMAEVDPELSALWRTCSAVEQRTLRLVDETDGAIYRSDALARIGLRKSSAQRAAENLEKRAELERGDDQGHRFVDPLFRLWIRRLAHPVA